MTWQKFAMSLRFRLMLFLAATCMGSTSAYILYVEGQECLTQHVDMDHSLIAGGFVVTDVDHMWTHGDESGTINFFIEGPTGYKIYSIYDKSEDKFQVRAVHQGNYKFCVENSHYMAATVDLTFHLNEERKVKVEDAIKGEDIDDLNIKLWQLQSDVWDVMQSQEHFKARDQRRKKTLESTNSRVLWYALLETAIIVAACALQIYVLQSLFERRSRRFGV